MGLGCSNHWSWCLGVLSHGFSRNGTASLYDWSCLRMHRGRLRLCFRRQVTYPPVPMQSDRSTDFNCQDIALSRGAVIWARLVASFVDYRFSTGSTWVRLNVGAHKMFDATATMMVNHRTIIFWGIVTPYFSSDDRENLRNLWGRMNRTEDVNPGFAVERWWVSIILNNFV